jgi:hypothetical protein
MKEVVCSLSHGDDFRLGRSHPFVEEAQFNTVGIFRKEGKVYPPSIPGSTERIRDARIFPDVQGI